MTRRTDKLYLIAVGYRTVAIIPAEDRSEAIGKYVSSMGFDKIYAYLCNLQMSNTININTRVNNRIHYLIITSSTETIGSENLSIDSQQVASCDDIFSWTDPDDINNPLFMRPTIEEVRGCVGFSKEPMYELRKFCR